MGNKRDWLYVGIMLIVMAVTSCAVQDSRAMTPPEPTILEKSIKEIINHIDTAYYIAYLKEPVQPAEEVTEEVTEEIQEDNAPAQTIEENSVERITYDESNLNPKLPFEEEEKISHSENSEPGLTYLGNFEITAYEWTGNPCANGNYPTEWYTVACNSLPFGTRVYIDNVGYFTVEDRGASWHSDNWMDIYMGDVLTCYHWGRQYIDVYLVD